MNVAFRTLFELMSRQGDPSICWERVAAAFSELDPSGPTDERELIEILDSAGQTSPRLLLAAIREVGVLSHDGLIDQGRVALIGGALGLVGDSFSPIPIRSAWQPVATVPERYWRGEALAPVLQTAGVILKVIEGAKRTLRIATPYVDGQAIDVIRSSVLDAAKRGVTVRVTTSPDHGRVFEPLVQTWRPTSGAAIRVVEVDSTLSPLGSHAKVVAADGLKAYLGSANLTLAGLGRQFELGAQVEGSGVVELERILDAVERLGKIAYEVA